VADHDLTGLLSGAAVPPELLEALARGVAAAFAPQPTPSGRDETTDFLTAGQFAVRLGVSRETVRRLAIANVLPFTVVCRGSRKTTRRYPRRFADEFAASGLDVTDLAEFAARWRARMARAGQ
jgi:excisionase family DNA binding protein